MAAPRKAAAARRAVPREAEEEEAEGEAEGEEEEEEEEAEEEEEEEERASDERRRGSSPSLANWPILVLFASSPALLSLHESVEAI